MKTALHPSSQACPIEKSDELFRFGKTCAVRASDDNEGIGKRPLSVDDMMELSGSRTF